MLVVSASKTYKVLPALVACLLAVAVVVCLVHTDGIDEVQTAHQGHRHASSSTTTRLTLDVHCLIAILPAMIALVWFCLGTLYSTPLLSHPVILAFSPFIPPKDIAHA